MSVETARFNPNAKLFNSYADSAQVGAQRAMEMRAEAEKRLTQIRRATRSSRHFGTMQSVTSRQMFRQNNRGVQQTFINHLRDFYEKRSKPVMMIQPWSTDSGMRNLPDRIFSQADMQRSEIKSSSSARAIAPPAASKPIAKEDLDAGLLELYTLPGSSGYAQDEDMEGNMEYVRDISEREAHQNVDSDPYVIPGSS